ncbi:Uncharacterised protein [Candidatus Venteria ishoeyi]|uniref:HicB family protein n=2 Tax=Candidatus Venteria ishoeyi TaxID=1899563 RepID=A0A1H6FHV6_9GAMM|nr:Uncharacterised protein [Candidatus Venteria ishoeyi]
MSKTQVVTLRMPLELKGRMEKAAKQQGVSLNSLANYMLTTQLSQLEFFSRMEQRLALKTIPDLKQEVGAILDTVPERDKVPEWDKL